MATVPGYKYLGPGNNINSGDPVNETDLVAQIHDLEYTTAETDKDIRKADIDAIEKFHEAPLSFGSLVGEIGIGVKYAVESNTGVLYGGGDMKRKHNFGNELYKSRQKAIYAGFREAINKGQYHDLRSYRESDEYKQILESHREGGSIYKRLKLDFGAFADEQPSTSRPRTDDNQPTTSTPRESEGSQTDFNENTFDWDTYFDDFVADLPDQTFASLPETSSMDIPQGGTDRGPTTGARSEVPQASSSSAGGNTPTFFSKSLPGNSTMMSFKKSRIMYSYGFATKNLQPANSTEDSITTPLALIPVDFLPFYLTQSEFQALPQGACITDLWCKVYPLGTRTAFDTGTTLSGSATSEYIPIGLSAIGINKDFYGRNKQYVTDPTKPMIPNSLKDIEPENMVKKYYDSVTSTTMLVPRSISEYYVHEWNRSSNPDREKYPDYQIHNNGVPHMDQKVNSFLINSMINQPIVQYIYKPKNGRINEAKFNFVPYNRKNFLLESEHIRGRSNKLLFFENADKTPALGVIGLSSEKAPPTIVNSVDENYRRQIENYGTFDPQSGITSYSAQPQVHVGIQATPQLNPANEDENFLNSCAYWRIECGCNIISSISSAFTKHIPIAWPREVKFIESAETGYTDGQTLFGNTDAKSGNIKNNMRTVIEDEFEFISKPYKKIKK